MSFGGIARRPHQYALLFCSYSYFLSNEFDATQTTLSYRASIQAGILPLCRHNSRAQSVQLSGWTGCVNERLLLPSKGPFKDAYCDERAGEMEVCTDAEVQIPKKRQQPVSWSSKSAADTTRAFRVMNNLLGRNDSRLGTIRRP